MAERREEGDDERALAARAAWLYHAGGLTQSAVARALGVNDVKAHRLLARAVRDGTVRVLVDGPPGPAGQWFIDRLKNPLNA